MVSVVVGGGVWWLQDECCGCRMSVVVVVESCGGWRMSLVVRG